MVLCRVTRLTTKQANVAVLVVGNGEEGRVCADEWAGVVRREDVRATEKEKVDVGKSFRVGDVVRGVVVCHLILVDILSTGEDGENFGGIYQGKECRVRDSG